jgi:formylglycine-generating enzyme
MNAPASVSTFRLDMFVVTVGRFRAFINAWDNIGYRPPPNSGKHTHLNSGQGLLMEGTTNVYESGWDTSDAADIATDITDWTTNLTANMTSPSWTQTPGGNERLPIVGVQWPEAYAFCIWDGGFLPSDNELAYAQSGGSQQLLYPWGSTTPDCSYADYGFCSSIVESVGFLPNGNGLWGQSDLVGNAWQWTVSWSNAYQVPCVDCTSQVECGGEGCSGKAIRGGSFNNDNTYLPPGAQNDENSLDDNNARTASGTYADVGFRCARIPN